MSVDYGANYIDAVEEEALLSMPRTGPALKALLDYCEELDRLGYNSTEGYKSIKEVVFYSHSHDRIESLCDGLIENPTGEDYDSIDKARIDKLIELTNFVLNSFMEETNGLELELIFVDPSVLIGGDLDEATAYGVSGLYGMTPEGKRFRDTVGFNRKWFVTAS